MNLKPRIAFAQSMPITQQFFSGSSMPVSSYHHFDFVNAVLGINRMPISYQFWFIRDLMVLVLLTPVIDFLIRHAMTPFVVTLFMCWMLGVWGYIPSSEAALFFTIGSA